MGLAASSAWLRAWAIDPGPARGAAGNSHRVDFRNSRLIPFARGALHAWAAHAVPCLGTRLLLLKCPRGKEQTSHRHAWAALHSHHYIISAALRECRCLGAACELPGLQLNVGTSLLRSRPRIAAPRTRRLRVAARSMALTDFAWSLQGILPARLVLVLPVMAEISILAQASCANDFSSSSAEGNQGTGSCLALPKCAV